MATAWSSVRKRWQQARNPWRVLGGGRRASPCADLRGPHSRMQSPRGGRRAVPDDLCRQAVFGVAHDNQARVRQLPRRRLVPVVRATGGSQRDDRPQFERIIDGGQRDVEHGSGRIRRRCAWMPFECGLAAGSSTRSRAPSNRRSRWPACGRIPCAHTRWSPRPRPRRSLNRSSRPVARRSTGSPLRPRTPSATIPVSTGRRPSANGRTPSRTGVLVRLGLSRFRHRVRPDSTSSWRPAQTDYAVLHGCVACAHSRRRPRRTSLERRRHGTRLHNRPDLARDSGNRNLGTWFDRSSTAIPGWRCPKSVRRYCPLREIGDRRYCSVCRRSAPRRRACPLPQALRVLVTRRLTPSFRRRRGSDLSLERSSHLSFREPSPCHGFRPSRRRPAADTTREGGTATPCHCWPCS